MSSQAGADPTLLLDDPCPTGWSLYGTIVLCDPEGAVHAAHGALLAAMLAEECRLDWPRGVFWGALLRDVGQLEVPEALLERPGPLSPDEREVVGAHAMRSAELLSSVAELRGAAPIALHHHERWDGTGRPDGLAGTEIPPECRVLAVADAFVALLARRPYRAALSPAHAADVLAEHAGNQFDPAVVETFEGLLPVLPDGLVEPPSGRELRRRVPALGDRGDRAESLSEAQLEALFAAALGLETAEAADRFGRALGTQRTWSASLRRVLACPPRVALDRFLTLLGRDVFRALLPVETAVRLAEERLGG